MVTCSVPFKTSIVVVSISFTNLHYAAEIGLSSATTSPSIICIGRDTFQLIDWWPEPLIRLTAGWLIKYACTITRGRLSGVPDPDIPPKIFSPFPGLSASICSYLSVFVPTHDSISVLRKGSIYVCFDYNDWIYGRMMMMMGYAEDVSHINRRISRGLWPTRPYFKRWPIKRVSKPRAHY